MTQLAARIAPELKLPLQGVAAVIALVEEGATVPFIARYRKEATSGLDEVQIRAIVERRDYLQALDERRATILRSIEEQGKLNAGLRSKLEACITKAELEDLYLPFKTKRRTKAMIAREAGLEPLARRILEQPQRGSLHGDAKDFVDAKRGVESIEQALEGARHIVVERIAEDQEVRAFLRGALADHGDLRSKGVKAKMGTRTKFEDYYDHVEPLRRIPSHRYLALCRGEAEGTLRVGVEIDNDRALSHLESIVEVRRQSPYAQALRDAMSESYKRRLLPSLGKDVRAEVAARAEKEAIEVFADNLQNLLLAAPYGSRAIVAIDPGIRTGCKCVALDPSGRFLDHVTIYPAGSEQAREKAKQTLERFIERHRPEAVAVGNGTGGRETEELARGVVKQMGKSLPVLSVNESGASIYSASDIAREEFPDLDLTLRGAISIGRRLQDPLAELVKLDPQAIGVGQYQHDVDQRLLSNKLKEVVESCVNRVGVELSTASVPLLSFVAGIGPKLAASIVAHRQQAGLFAGRRALLKVKGLGPKAYEQCAGFLRIRDSDNPLDASAVHPERYKLVSTMARDLGVPLKKLVGDASAAANVDLTRYVSSEVGEPTLRDIVSELSKPGRDPRDAFEVIRFRDDVQEMRDLVEGMQLRGVVTNVAAFGAFVDIGVHQDGLIHVSELADQFVQDPRAVVKVGDAVNVRVLSVDLERKRISLSRKSAP